MSSKAQRRSSNSNPAAGKTSRGSSSKKPGPAQEPRLSFLFIVNELGTNDDVPPRYINQRWHPPLDRRAFYAQVSGHVFRWSDGVVSLASGYSWSAMQVSNPEPAFGAITAPEGYAQPVYFRAATVFYCNHFDKFFTTPGDATAQDMAMSEWGWLPLSFYHIGNTSYVDHAGDQEYLAVRDADWIEQLVPKTYRCHHTNGPVDGGLAGNLPILIALVAFSCASQADLWHVLINERAWRDRRWRQHSRHTIRREQRGVVVSVYTDPENPQGSTHEALQVFEMGAAIFE